MKKIKIIHLYPKEMNIYGDNGNLLVLKKRLEWRGINSEIIGIGIGEEVPRDANMIVGGGGQDAGQKLIENDLKTKKGILIDLAESQVPMLMICGMYQMLGKYFKTQSGEVIEGIGLLDVYTEAASGRLIGNIVSKSEWGDLIGYENHSGLTYLEGNILPIGRVPKKQGNNGKDKTEGARKNNVFGSYMHGPLLAKSPQFADYLIELALSQIGYQTELKDIDDGLEHSAARIAKKLAR